MTNNNSNDRLDRIERILENIAIRQKRLTLQEQERRAEFDRNMQELKSIVMSNSRSIQAIQEQQATERLRDEERRRNHEERMRLLENNQLELTEISRGLANMYVGLDENQPTILRRLMSIENKVDRILDREDDR
jgi:hypothetical protein